MFSEEVRKKISLAGKGRKQTEQTKQKIALAKCKKVYCVELDRIFNSSQEASKVTRVKPGNISCCLTGKSKSAGGYH